MPANRLYVRFTGPLPVLFWSFLVALAVFGGASRADVPAQMIVRAIASVVLASTLMLTSRFDRRDRDVALILAATALIIAVQLLPLPPALWRALPGHAPLAQADQLARHAPLWRPLSLVPEATLNSLFALLPPLTVLALVSGRGTISKGTLPRAILLIAAINSGVGFIQFIGGQFDNPFINDTPTIASGFMANRNHQAALLALGIAAAPASLMSSRHNSLAAAAGVAGISLWFTCLILATGSRAGMALAAIAWAGAIAIAWPTAAPAMRRLPRAAMAVLGVGSALLVGGVVTISILAGRAVSVQRLAELEVGDDMRGRALPVVWSILWHYFPTGIGAGSFDPVFRMHEPFDLLKPTYFNHAHNDWLEVAVTTGLAGVLLLATVVVWWLWLALPAWRNPHASTGRTGSLAILLLMLASIVDYPLRTPTMMGVLVLAACMTARSREHPSDSPLPTDAGRL